MAQFCISANEMKIQIFAFSAPETKVIQPLIVLTHQAGVLIRETARIVRRIEPRLFLSVLSHTSFVFNGGHGDKRYVYKCSKL